MDRFKLTKQDRINQYKIIMYNVKGDLDNLTGDGGRLFMVISEADNLVQAQDNVYSYLSKLDLPDCFYRHDIGNRALRD